MRMHQAARSQPLRPAMRRRDFRRGRHFFIQPPASIVKPLSIKALQRISPRRRRINSA